MLYQDKSQEEIEAIVERYKENYYNTFGVHLSKDQIQRQFDEMIKKKEESLFSGVFESMTPKSLRLAKDQIVKDPVPKEPVQVVKPKVKKSK